MSFELSIFYTIVEDGDDENFPNVFLIPFKKEDSQLTLGHLREVFPFPGTYHFRVKQTYLGEECWLDLRNNEEVIPIMYDHMTFLKVSRLSHEITDTTQTRLKQMPHKQAYSDNIKTQDISIKKKLTRANSSNGISIDTKIQTGSNTSKQTTHADLLGFDFSANTDTLASSSPLSVTKDDREGLLETLDWDNFNADVGSTTSSPGPIPEKEVSPIKFSTPQLSTSVAADTYFNSFHTRDNSSINEVDSTINHKDNSFHRKTGFQKTTLKSSNSKISDFFSNDSTLRSMAENFTL